jgi:hypothetical protein
MELKEAEKREESIQKMNKTIMTALNQTDLNKSQIIVFFRQSEMVIFIVTNKRKF